MKAEVGVNELISKIFLSPSSILLIISSKECTILQIKKKGKEKMIGRKGRGKEEHGKKLHMVYILVRTE
jgi:hypothetical protein